MKTKQSTLFIMLIMVVTFLCGCGANKITEGYLCTYADGSPLTIDSIWSSDSGSDEIISNTQSALFRRRGDGSMTPDLAESYDVSDDGTVYTFHLRDTKWSNGEQVTASDFVFGMREYLRLGGGMPGVFIEMAHIKNAAEIYYGDDNGNHLPVEELGIRAIDDKTLEITLERPVSYFLSLLSLRNFAPINEQFYKSQEEGMYATGPNTIICSGAFAIEDYIPGTTTVLVKKNPYYWDADNVKLPGIKFMTIDDADTAVAAFKIKALDSTRISAANRNDCLNDEELGKYLQDYTLGAFTYLIVNLDEASNIKTCQNRNLRLAISNALDRDSMCKNILNGSAQPCYTPLPQGTFFNKDTEEDFITDIKAYSEYCDFNVKRAQECFEEAKKELGMDKITLSLMIPSTSIKIGQVIKEQLERNLKGLTVNLDVVQFGELLTRRDSHDFEITITGYLPDFIDPMALLLLYVDDNELNSASFHSDEFMEIYNKCDIGEYSSDYTKRWEAMQTALEFPAKEQAVIPLYVLNRSVLSYDNLKGVDYLVGGPVIYQDAYREEP